MRECQPHVDKSKIPKSGEGTTLDLSKRKEGSHFATNDAWAALREWVREGLERLVKSQPSAGHTQVTAPAVVMEDVKERWRQLSPDITAGCASLAREGWFPDDEWSWSTVVGLAEMDLTQFEQELVEHYERRLQGIQGTLGHAYPARRDILRQAFAAHEAAQYALSTPVFIAQAEGITVDVMGRCGYSACQSKGGVETYELGKHLDQCSAGDTVLRPFLEAFVSRPPLLGTKKDREANPRFGMNRHLVLHGLDTDYATKANSCKAMSWLYWVHWTLESVRVHGNAQG